jgi:uncharacterized integral membrane protein (TIGR00698 family)
MDKAAILTMVVCSLIVVGSTLLADYRAWNRKGRTASLLVSKKYITIGLCILIAVLATFAGKAQRYVGAPIISLVIGILLVNILPTELMSETVRKHAASVGKTCLNFGIIALGATLSIAGIFNAAYALPLILFNICLSFTAAYLVGQRALKLSPNTCILVGGGTSICGGTAIAALSPVIKAKEEETAYAMASIFLFDLLACFTYPYLAFSLGLNEVQFGFLAGTAINDTSSVVAAQETYASLMNMELYAMPATIKVVRTTMIILLVMVFSIVTIRKEAKVCDSSAAQAGNTSLSQVVWAAFPKFILWFIGAVVLNTVFSNTYIFNTGFYTQIFMPFFSNGYRFFVAIALGGIGLKIKFRDILTKGIKPILLGGCTWLALFVSSILYSVLFL